MVGPAPGSEVVHLPARAIKTPEQRKKYDRARAAWRAKKSTDTDKWIPLDREVDSVLGYERIFEYNVETEQIRITTRALYTQALLNQNRNEYNESIGKRFRGADKGGLTKVASIPANLLFGPWRQAYMENDTKWMNKQLNDPDNQKLRTFRGRL